MVHAELTMALARSVQSRGKWHVISNELRSLFNFRIAPKQITRIFSAAKKTVTPKDKNGPLLGEDARDGVQNRLFYIINYDIPDPTSITDLSKRANFKRQLLSIVRAGMKVRRSTHIRPPALLPRLHARPCV
jgi:hypothetical protein